MRRARRDREGRGGAGADREKERDRGGQRESARERESERARDKETAIKTGRQTDRQRERGDRDNGQTELGSQALRFSGSQKCLPDGRLCGESPSHASAHQVEGVGGSN